MRPSPNAGNTRPTAYRSAMDAGDAGDLIAVFGNECVFSSDQAAMVRRWRIFTRPAGDGSLRDIEELLLERGVVGISGSA